MEVVIEEVDVRDWAKSVTCPKKSGDRWTLWDHEIVLRHSGKRAAPKHYRWSFKALWILLGPWVCPVNISCHLDKYRCLFVAAANVTERQYLTMSCTKGIRVVSTTPSLIMTFKKRFTCLSPWIWTLSPPLSAPMKVGVTRFFNVLTCPPGAASLIFFDSDDDWFWLLWSRWLIVNCLESPHSWCTILRRTSPPSAATTTDDVTDNCYRTARFR